MSGQMGERSALDDVKAELVAREPIFHKPELGTTREAYLAQTAEDYWEVGASGHIYDRDFVVEELVKRGKVTGDEHWVISDAVPPARARHVRADLSARPGGAPDPPAHTLAPGSRRLEDPLPPGNYRRRALIGEPWWMPVTRARSSLVASSLPGVAV